ncbi:hypothetical protein P154DRAFT_529181 [Amniculicola lignicola CBS 123094]|uniref:Uncharacterized protein n=1 Tax=Amniculicola lignicola CBS 123094 TaxID=1392246 RepID=A0A6A5X3T0_9PLEO|nr:hypothetical protein P154DRAFT_529181 [Amniculicola lignicola CBS 123094]
MWPDGRFFDDFSDDDFSDSDYSSSDGEFDFLSPRGLGSMFPPCHPPRGAGPRIPGHGRFVPPPGGRFAPPLGGRFDPLGDAPGGRFGTLSVPRNGGSRSNTFDHLGRDPFDIEYGPRQPLGSHAFGPGPRTGGPGGRLGGAAGGPGSIGLGEFPGVMPPPRGRMPPRGGRGRGRGGRGGAGGRRPRRPPGGM